jgi:flavodoxin/ferredoxin
MNTSCIITYFSQSGNTKKMAYAAREGIKKFTGQCDIVPMTRLDVLNLVDYDVIGVGSPCWSGVPTHVKQFIDSIPALPGKHAFTFSTHGVRGDRFLPEMVRLLMGKGLSVIGTRDWYCSVNHPLIPKPYLTDGHPDEIDLSEAEHFAIEMVEVSRRLFAGETGLIPPVPAMVPPRTLSRPQFQKKLNMLKCLYPKCRLCMDNCRLKIIDLSVSPPAFPEQCEPCYFCEMICPTGAIEADYEADAVLETGRARTMFINDLRKAEVAGRFRRLIPEEKVGWDNPFYKRYSSHPRYVIPEENLDD